MKIAVFRVAEPCILVDVYRRFRGACCLPPDYTALQPRTQTSSSSNYLGYRINSEGRNLVNIW
jgi:hypothetical protein